MLLARMAEAVYWAGRYLERAEDTARIVQVHGETHIDLPVGEDVGWAPLVEIAGSMDRVPRTQQPAGLEPDGGRRQAVGRGARRGLCADRPGQSVVDPGVDRRRPGQPAPGPACRAARGLGAVQRTVDRR